MLRINTFQNSFSPWIAAFTLAFLQGVSLGQIASKPTPNADVLWIDDFEWPVQNQVKGRRNCFQKSPSSASFLRTREIDGTLSDRGYSLCLTGEKRADGWCGFWLHLFDDKNGREWLDATSFDYLSIWIKGKTGNESVAIKVADQYWYEKDDSSLVARTEKVLSGGISTEWQEIRIPVAKMRRLNPKRLASIIFEFERLGKQTLYIDDISLRTETGLSVQLPRKKYGVGRSEKLPPKSLWVWQTEALINDTSKRKELFEFCQQQDIRSLWLQILYEVDRFGRNGPEAQIRFAKQFRRLNAEANASGISVHALDGYPEYALDEQQFIPLTLVQSLIDFNQESAPSERFKGVHFDNEPHLLVGWHSPKHRKQILAEFLSLNAKCQKLVREKSNMEFGIDIPFWWEEIDPLTKIPCGQVYFNGTTKPASFHCIDMLDNVGVMNYRDTADGTDGMIRHGRDLLSYAEKKRACDIYMGVETFAYPPLRIEFLFGMPAKDFYAAMDGSARLLGRLSRIQNYRIRVFNDGSRIHVGLEHPEDATKFDRKTFDAGLAFIADQLNVSPASEKDVAWESFASALGSSGEYKDVAYTRIKLGSSIAKVFPDYSGSRSFHGLVATALMSPKITFAEESIEAFELQTGLASEYFANFEAYSGIAVHCYDTFRRMKSEASHSKEVAVDLK